MQDIITHIAYGTRNSDGAQVSAKIANMNTFINSNLDAKIQVVISSSSANSIVNKGGVTWTSIQQYKALDVDSIRKI